MNKKLFIYVQHLLGVGHLKRMALIAKAAAASGMNVVLASGGKNFPHLDCGVAKLFQLPPAFSDAAFSHILDEKGEVVTSAWKEARTELLLNKINAFKPDLLLVEMYPFGRRMFRFELTPLLQYARNATIPTICSVRDILVKKSKPEREREIVEVLDAFFDRILVHGDPNICPFNFPLLDFIKDKIRYTGYVAQQEDIPVKSGAEILVSAGGGAVGFDMIKQALEAKPQTMFHHSPWRIITGGNISDENYRELSRYAEKGVSIEKFRPDFVQLLAECRLSISQGGYNTILEILQCKKPALIIPFAEGEESEQEIRAALLAQKGLLEWLSSNRIKEDMAQAIDRAGRLEVPRIELDMNGIHNTLTYLKELASG